MSSHPLNDGAALKGGALSPGQPLSGLDTLLIDLLPAAVYVCEAPSGAIVRYNRRAVALWGREPAPGDTEARFGTGYRLLAPDGSPLPFAQSPMAEVLRTGEAIRDRELVIEQPDGSRRTALINIEAIRDPSGGIIGAVSVFQDITERKGIEDALRASEERLRQDVTERAQVQDALRMSEERHRQLADNLPSGFIYQIIARPGEPNRFSYVSAGVEGLCEVTPAEIVADPMALYGLIVEEDVPGMMAAEAESLRTGAPFNCQFRVTSRSGRVRWLHCRSAARPQPDGSAIWDGVASDITDRVEMEQALRDADRRKDEFLAMLAHELRNPLAPVRYALQILRTPGASPAMLSRARETTERQVGHMARLIDDLLEASRVTRGKIQLQLEPVDVVPVLHRAVDLTLPALQARQHVLKLELTPGSRRMRADPARLEQVFVNLLTNAAKYTPPGGQIRVTATYEGDTAVVRLVDTGVGIAPELLPRIFDLFVQAEQRADRTQGGLGIGLTLVKALVELHGGTVQVESAGVGQGSTFTVTLPLEAAAQVGGEPAGVAEPATAPRPKRVLVVDDNTDAAETMAFLLKLQGHEVRTAADGPSALTVAGELQPEIVFLDIGLPGMDGYQVARRLRAEQDGRSLTLVAVTGYGQDEDRRRSAEAGFDHHLVKPAEAEAVEKILAG